MSQSTFRLFPSRLAKGVALSLAVSFAAPAVQSTELPDTPTPGETKEQSQLDASQEQTRKIQSGLPNLGDGTGEDAESAAEKQSRLAAAAAQLGSTAASALQQNAKNGVDVDVGDAMTDKLVNMGLGAGVDAARASGLPFLGTMTGTVSYGKKRGFDVNLQTIGLLRGRDSAHKLLAQLGAHDEGDRPTGNLGLVYRYLAPEAHWLFGANAFYDHDFGPGAHRLGFGVEAASRQLRSFANYYTRASDRWVDDADNEDLVERAATGYDLGVTLNPANIPGLDLRLKAAWWQGDRVDVFGVGQTIANPNVWSVRLGYSPVPLFGFSVEHEKVLSGPSDTRLMFNLRYEFGKPLQAQLEKQNLAQQYDLASRALAPVERQHRIVTEKKDKWDPIEFLGPELVQATIDEGELYTYLLQVKGGKPPFVFSLTGADAALFTLVGQELRFTGPAPSAGQDNFYEVSVQVRGARGDVATKRFRIEVIPLPAGPLAVAVYRDGKPLQGRPMVGQTLTANVTCGSRKCPDKLDYQWEIEDTIGSGRFVPLTGATTIAYLVQRTDQRRRIRVQASAPKTP